MALLLFLLLVFAIVLLLASWQKPTPLPPFELTSRVRYPIAQIVREGEIVEGCNVVRVGMHVGVDPTSGFNQIQDGFLVGSDVDLAQNIATFLGKKLVIVDIPFSQLETRLQQGRVDLLISQMNQTADRSERYAQIPYRKGLNSSYILGTRQDIAAQIQQAANPLVALEQIANLKFGIAVPAGTVQAATLLKMQINNALRNLPIVLVNDTPEALALLRSGLVGGYLVDFPLKERDIVNIPVQSPIPGDIVGDFALGINPQCCSLLQKVGSIVKRIYPNAEIPPCRNPAERCLRCFSS